MLPWIPIDAQKFAFALLLSFLIGLEHEEHKGEMGGHYSFGGIRTFPLLGISGFTAALLSASQPPVLGYGLLVIGALMTASFVHKTRTDKSAGMTSEISGLLTYLLGAVVYQEHYWAATALVVAGVLILELKKGLEGLVKRIPSKEILTFSKFLLLTAVIFPILPNEAFTPFQINPQRIWLIVVAISALSYGSYILQKLRGDQGAMLSAFLGGAYSSTLTTIALAKESRGQKRPHLYTGAILTASGTMYLRLAVLVALFSTPLRLRLCPILCVLGALGVTGGVLWGRRSDGSKQIASTVQTNPFEIRAALGFAMLFMLMMILTHWVLQNAGTPGIYALSVLSGVTDVDPFIMSLTQSAGLATPELVAAIGILVAAASNNFIKGIYARSLAGGETGKQGFLALVALGGLGLVAILALLAGA